MGTQDDPDPRRTPDEGPARPEQTDEGFATGADHKPDPPEEDLEPDFARGVAETDPNKHGRFSTGEEQLPDSPDKEHEGSFGESDET